MKKKGKTKKRNSRKARPVHKKTRKIRHIKIKKPSRTRKILHKIKSVKNIFVKKGRVSTGIPSFDSMIQGGFEEHSINLLVGSLGCGKTIFTSQFLFDGLRKKEKVLYITFEEKKEEFYKNMKDFGWDLENYEKKGLFIFLEYSPEKVRIMLEEGGGEIERIVTNEGVKRLVIDSITSFALLFEDELIKRSAIVSLFDMIRKWKCTSLLTLQDDPTNKDRESLSIEFEADGIILLYFVRYQGKRQRFIEVLKMRGTNHSTEIYPFQIGGSTGVSIIKKAVRGKLV